MNPAYIRVGLRYLTGYLVIKGLLPEDLVAIIEADQELAVMIGAAIAVCVEWAYAKAKSWGWRT